MGELYLENIKEEETVTSWELLRPEELTLLPSWTWGQGERQHRPSKILKEQAKMAKIFPILIKGAQAQYVPWATS